MNSADLLSSSVWRDRAKWFFAAGQVAGGATSGLVIVVLGSLLRPLIPEPGRYGTVLVVLALVAGHEFGLYRLPLPQNARQVPQSVIFAGGRVGALQFGFEMGTGVRTFMTSALPHFAAVAGALVAPWWAALAMGAAFGAGRAAMPMLRMRWQPPSAWDARFADRRRRVALALLVADALAVAGAVVVGLP